MRKEPTFGPARKAGDEAVDEVIDDRVDEEFLHEIPDHGEEIVVKRGRFGPTIERAKTAFTWVKKYERTLSAFGMVAGFITDNLMFRRIDLPNTQAIFAAYLGVAAFSIVGLHFLERRAREGRAYARWRAFFPMATQFALGGLWSAFLVFYSRSAVLTKSWPYLALLTAFFIGNEVLKRYHSRLVFTTTLFFFAVFTCAIVTVPVYTHTIGKFTFLVSGGIAVGVLVLFLYLLAAVNRPQFVAARGKIALGVAGVYVLMNVFYFTNTLPPLPLALAHVGVYHAVKKTGDIYQAVAEDAPWYTEFGFPPTLHVTAGQPLYAYSAVFAPIKLSTKIVHRWRRYDPKTGHWITLSTVTFPINGGRDGGYRGYTIKHNIQPGDWRVDINTYDGHLIGRITFKVDRADTQPSAMPETLK
jgi:MFS family permease